MNNEVKLFARKNGETVLSEPETRISTAVTSILVSTGQLRHTVKELARHFDAIENCVYTIDDTETRDRLKQSTKLSRETPLKAMLQLTQQIGKLVGRGGV